MYSTLSKMPKTRRRAHERYLKCILFMFYGSFFLLVWYQSQWGHQFSNFLISVSPNGSWLYSVFSDCFLELICELDIPHKSRLLLQEHDWYLAKETRKQASEFAGRNIAEETGAYGHLMQRTPLSRHKEFTCIILYSLDSNHARPSQNDSDTI